MNNRFCPSCGWEGEDIICPECGEKTESLEVDEETGQPIEKDHVHHDLKDFNDIEDDEELDEGSFE